MQQPRALRATGLGGASFGRHCMQQPRALRATGLGGASFGRGWASVEDAGEKQQQIPFGNDNKKSKGNGKSKSNSNGNSNGNGKRKSSGRCGGVADG